MVSVDILSLKPSNFGRPYLVVFCDYFSKWIECFPTENMLAKTIADLFVNQIVLRYGEPKRLLSDQGKNVDSNLIRDICAILGTKKVRTTPYHPQGDGLVERCNKTIIEQLKRYLVHDDKGNWEKYLPFILFSYRSTPHESTKQSPYFLLFGRQPNLQIDNQLLTKMTSDMQFDSYRYFVGKTLKDTQEIVLENVKKAQEKQKFFYDRKTKTKSFKPGDLVAIKAVQKCKLDETYSGPFIVVGDMANLAPNTIRVAPVGNQAVIQLVSIERVKPWYATASRIQC